MQTIKLLAIVLLAVVGFQNGNAAEKVETKGKTKVYYFHNTRRCMTCNAIEKVAKSTLEKSFSKELKEGNIVFETYNAEEKANKTLCKEMGVTGSALIVMKGEEKIDLTSKGFMYAVRQPEKLKEAIVKALKD